MASSHTQILVDIRPFILLLRTNKRGIVFPLNQLQSLTAKSIMYDCCKAICTI